MRPSACSGATSFTWQTCLLDSARSTCRGSWRNALLISWGKVRLAGLHVRQMHQTADRIQPCSLCRRCWRCKGCRGFGFESLTEGFMTALHLLVRCKQAPRAGSTL